MILAELDKLIKQAESQGKWLHCSYQDMWFSPAELRNANNEGRFIWGAVNWKLRDPLENIKYLHGRIEQAQKDLINFQKRVSA